MALQIPTINDQDSASAIDVAEQVFGQEFNETLVHQLVVRHLAGARAGTKAQKIVRQLLVVELSLGDKKERDAQERVQ